MVGRVQQDVVDYKPGKCIVAGGTNDIGLEWGVNDKVMTNLTQIVAKLQAGSIKPFLCTLPPRGNGVNDFHLNDLNTRIRAFTADAANDATLIDVYAAVADPMTGNYRTGYSYDGVHMTEAGAKATAEFALRTVPSLYGTAALPYLPTIEPDGRNLLTGGLFKTDSNRDGVPDHWSVPAKAPGTARLIPVADGAGNWFEVTRDTKGTGQAYAAQNRVTSTVAAGTKVAFVGRVQSQDAGKGTLRVSVSADFLNSRGSTISSLTPLAGSALDISDGQWFIRGTVPAAMSSIAVRLTVESGAGKVRFAQIGLVKE
jgi:hypothetical protein